MSPRSLGEPPRQHSECFQPEERLKKRREFLKVQRTGRKVHLRDLLVFVRRGLDRRRVGITVTKKVGVAVVRNRIKRLVREVWRRQRQVLPDGYDYVFVAKISAATMTYADLRRQMTTLSKKLDHVRR